MDRYVIKEFNKHFDSPEFLVHAIQPVGYHTSGNDRLFLFEPVETQYNEYFEALNNSVYRDFSPDFNYADGFGFIRRPFDNEITRIDRGVKREMDDYFMIVWQGDTKVVEIPAWLFNIPFKNYSTPIYHYDSAYYPPSGFVRVPNDKLTFVLRNGINLFGDTVYQSHDRHDFIYISTNRRALNMYGYYNGRSEKNSRLISIRTPVNANMFRFRQDVSDTGHFSIDSYADFEVNGHFSIQRMFIPFSNYFRFIDLLYGVSFKYILTGIDIVKPKSIIPIAIQTYDYSSNMSFRNRSEYEITRSAMYVIDTDIEVVEGDVIRAYYRFEVDMVSIGKLTGIKRGGHHITDSFAEDILNLDNETGISFHFLDIIDIVPAVMEVIDHD